MMITASDGQNHALPKLSILNYGNYGLFRTIDSSRITRAGATTAQTFFLLLLLKTVAKSVLVILSTIQLGRRGHGEGCRVAALMMHLPDGNASPPAFNLLQGFG